jgi:hypothetical protein
MDHEHVDRTVEELKETMDVIRQVLEIREELQWGVRNNRVRVVTVAADSAADDMRLNDPPGQSAEALADSLGKECPVKQGELL